MKEHVLLGHGSGGSLSRELLEDVFLQAYTSSELLKLEDQAKLDSEEKRICFTTDSYVVDPLEFPGGDIGCMAIHGTVNDLAVGGAEPRWIAVAFILEEGLDIQVLKRIVQSISQAAKNCAVEIVTGDTKVVPRGKADRLFINTSGIGVLGPNIQLGAKRIREGDRILVNGTLGDHGVTIMAAREGLRLGGDLRSDTASVWPGVCGLLERCGEAVHALRDPTRGGLASTLNELAQAAGVAIEVKERGIPISPAVNSACEMLGLDPLQVANEGKVVAFVAPESAEEALKALQESDGGEDAAMIGEVVQGPEGRITLRTEVGGSRILPLLSGDLLPRIC